MMIVSVASQNEGLWIGCQAGAVQAALGHPKFGSKFHSTLMRDDFFVRIKSSAFVRAIVRSSQTVMRTHKHAD